MKNYKNEWEQSYANADNFMFYPDYNVIWFVAKFIKRRVGLNEFKIFRDFNDALDLGCGIGSNLIFLNDYGFDAYGVDLSENALDFAKIRVGGNTLSEKLIQASADSLPFNNEKFDFIVSHGVLDSVPIKIAKAAFGEAHRVLRKNGLFYASLICSDGVHFPPEFSGEILVDEKHEKGTIQLYYNWTLINEMIAGKFKITECKLTTEQMYNQVNVSKRYAVVMEKI